MLAGSRRGGLKSAMVLLLTARPGGLPGSRTVRRRALARPAAPAYGGGRSPATAGLVLFRSPLPPLSPSASALTRGVLAAFGGRAVLRCRADVRRSADHDSPEAP